MVTGFCAEFFAWKNDNLQGRFRYERSKAPLGATALTYADGTVRSEISQGRIGNKLFPEPLVESIYTIPTHMIRHWKKTILLQI